MLGRAVAGGSSHDSVPVPSQHLLDCGTVIASDKE